MPSGFVRPVNQLSLHSPVNDKQTQRQAQSQGEAEKEKRIVVAEEDDKVRRL